jgi:hypothetical protein
MVLSGQRAGQTTAMFVSANGEAAASLFYCKAKEADIYKLESAESNGFQQRGRLYSMYLEDIAAIRPIARRNILCWFCPHDAAETVDQFDEMAVTSHANVVPLYSI